MDMFAEFFGVGLLDFPLIDMAYRLLQKYFVVVKFHNVQWGGIGGFEVGKYVGYVHSRPFIDGHDGRGGFC